MLGREISCGKKWTQSRDVIGRSRGEVCIESSEATTASSRPMIYLQVYGRRFIYFLNFFDIFLIF